jgi:predicted transcriptional regulator
MKRTNVWLKASQIRQLKSLANDSGATTAGLIRKAIDEFIERRKAEKAAHK